MALVLADRVKDTTTTTGTGTVTLSGVAPAGFQDFTVIGNGNTTYYTIAGGSEWEVGIGTYATSGPTLARTTVLSSSNGGGAVSFSSGTKDVFVTYPSERSVNLNSAALTSGRVPFVTTDGLLTDAAALTFNGTALTTPTFAAYRETTTTNATVTGTFTVDMAVANIFNLTQTGSTTYTFSNPAAGGTTSNFLIAIKQGGVGSFTATWPASVKFPNGSTPVLTTAVGKVDIFNFISFDGGTTYFGSLSLANL